MNYKYRMMWKPVIRLPLSNRSSVRCIWGGKEMEGEERRGIRNSELLRGEPRPPSSVLQPRVASLLVLRAVMIGPSEERSFAGLFVHEKRRMA